MPGERTGMGDTLAQVTAFRLDRAVLFGYVDAAHQRTVERVATLTPTPVGAINSVSRWGEAAGVESPGGHVWRFGTTYRTDRLPRAC